MQAKGAVRVAPVRVPNGHTLPAREDVGSLVANHHALTIPPSDDRWNRNRKSWAAYGFGIDTFPYVERSVLFVGITTCQYATLVACIIRKCVQFTPGVTVFHFGLATVRTAGGWTGLRPDMDRKGLMISTHSFVISSVAIPFPSISAYIVISRVVQPFQTNCKVFRCTL